MNAGETHNQSDHCLQSLLEETPAVIYTFTLVNGVPDVQFISENVKTVMGYEPREFIHNFNFWKSRVHPVDLEIIIKKLNESGNFYKPDIESYSEYRFKHRDGSYRWTSDRKKPRTNARGELVIVGVLLDITALKEAQEAETEAKEATRRLNAILGAIPDLFFMLDKNGIYHDVIAADTSLLIAPPDKVVGHSVFEFFPEQEATRQFGMYQQCLREKRLVIFEYQVNFGTGKRYFEARLNPVGDENLLAIIRDVTERKQADHTIRKFKTMADQASIGTAIVYLDGMIHYMNNAFAAMHGYSPEEISGRHIRVLYNPDQWPRIRELLNLIMNNGAIINEELYQCRKDHSVFPVLLNATLVHGDQDEAPFISVTIIDLTEKKAFESELISAKEKAEESNRLKTAFINNISHEIRTPLNGILGFGEMMANERLDQETRAEYLSILNKSSRRLLETITQIIDISEITTGSMKPEPSEVKPEPLLRELHQELERMVKGKNIRSTLRIPSEHHDYLLTTDPELLRKILWHLLANAAKFTEKGSIDLGYELEDHSIRFFVRDTGRGIAAPMLEKIFDPFMQEDISSTRGYEGTGLGLTIARGIAGLLGGRLFAKSAKGEGSSFYFEMPLSGRWKRAQEIREEPVTIDPSPRPLILITEDDEINQLFFTTVLKNAGFDFMQAWNGEEAVEFCRTIPGISLVLMDIKLPELNGMKAVELIRGFHPGLPVIAITAYAKTGDAPLILSAGFNDYLAKPIRENDLIAKVRQYLTP